MSWGRVDDSMLNHRKFEGLALAAVGLWCRGLAYCSNQLTDGVIPTNVVARLARSHQAAKKLARILVERRLWDQREDGYMMHNYLKWNPSKEQVLATQASRRLGAAITNTHRWGGRSSDQSSDRSSDTLPVAPPIAPAVALSHPIPSHELPVVSGSPPRGDAAATLCSPSGLAPPPRSTPPPIDPNGRMSRDQALADLARLTGTTVEELREAAAKLRRPR